MMRTRNTPKKRPHWPLPALALLTALLGWQIARGELPQLWMIWSDPRPDPGRVSQPSDPIADWSAKRAITDRIALRTTPTPTTAESIPMPLAPGSHVTSFEIPPEDISQLIKPSTPASPAAT
ncbi:MAG: hypothetical protein FWD61_15060, partial [Phycisphaerales bacterium]|nr:hypothetical protein [Phycisphaerales bacterium]